MLGLRSHAQQIHCIDTLKALAQGVFSGVQQQQYALQVAQIDEYLAITEAILAVKDPARRQSGWAEKLQDASEAMNKVEVSRGKLHGVKYSSFNAVKTEMGQNVLDGLDAMFHSKMLIVLAASDPFMLLEVLQEYWAATHPRQSKLQIRAEQLKDASRGGQRPSLSVLLARSRSIASMTDNPELASDGILAHLGPVQHQALEKTRLRFFNMNGQDGNTYLDSLSVEAQFKLADEEIALVNRSHERSHGMALYSETKSMPCPMPGHFGHTEDRCRTLATAKAKQTSSKGTDKGVKAKSAKASECYACQEVGHRVKECPYMRRGAVAAPQAIVNVAAVPPAIDTRGMSEAELQRLATIMSERAAAATNAEDSGIEAVARAYVVSAFSRSTIVQLGIDSMANRHLISDRSLFDPQTPTKFLEKPLLITGVCGDILLQEYGTAILDGIRLNNVFFCPSTPVNVVSLAALRAQYPTWKATLPQGAICLHDTAGNLKINAVIVNGLYLWRLNQTATETPITRTKAAALLTALERGAAVVAADVNVPLGDPAPGNSFASFMFLHRVLGHPSLKRMRWLQKVFPRLHFGQFPPSIFCDACLEGKSKCGSVPAAAPVGNKLPLDFFYD